MQMAKFRTRHHVLGLIASLSWVGPVAADGVGLQTCSSVAAQPSSGGEFGPFFADDTAQVCAINWVQNNRLMRVIWSLSEGDFESPVMRENADGEAVLTSSRPPRLLDVDGDGWLDLTTFTLIGMVNGDYSVFRYDPQAAWFVDFGAMNGHSFMRHESGFYISAARNNAATTNIAFFEERGGKLEQVFVLEVSAYETSENGGRAQCAISTDGVAYRDVFDPAGQTAYLKNYPDMVQSYCDIYRYPDAPSNDVSLSGNAPDLNIVPENTLFYCRLEGGTKGVTVSQDVSGYRYAYGPIGAAPELVLDRAADQVDVLSNALRGQLRVGEMAFENGDFTYVVSHSYDEKEAEDARAFGNQDAVFGLKSFSRGLRVYRGGVGTEPIFDKVCAADASYDAIDQIAPN